MSLSGIVPLGVFVLSHVLAMGQALLGPRAFGSALAELTPVRLGLEAVLIGVPLAFHAGLGLALAARSRSNIASYPYPANHAWALQRVSGLLVLVFLLVHVWHTRVALLLGRTTASITLEALAARLSATGLFGLPYLALFYLLGVSATVFHLAHGIVGFCASFGLVDSLERLRAVTRYVWLGAACVFLLGVATVIHIATGSALPWGAP